MALTEKYVSDAGAGAHDGSSEANAFSWAEMITDISAGSKAGNRYNVKGAITRTTNTDNITAGGSSTSPVIIRGYLTTIGDGYLGRTSGNGALVETNLPTISYTTGRLNITGTFILIESTIFTGAPSAAAVTLGADCVLTRSKVTNSSTNAAAIAVNAAAARAVAYDCDIALSGASGGNSAISTGAANARVIANRITGGPASGVMIGNAAPAIIDNLIYACASMGITQTATGSNPLIHGNTIATNTGDGIDILTGTSVLQCITNNMITDNSGFGIDGNNAAVAIFAAHNRTRDNSGGATNLADDWLAATKYAHVTADTGGAETDYVNAAGGDYNLIATSPAVEAGQLAKRSIGALQRTQVETRPMPAGLIIQNIGTY